MCCSVLFYVLCVNPCSVLSSIYWVFLHVLCIASCIVFSVYIVYCFMSYAWLHVLCAASCLTLNSMYCVLCHALCLTPCPCAVSWLVLVSMPLCCVVSRLVLAPMPCVPFHISHFSSCMPRASQVSFWTYIWFFKMIYPKFLWLTNRYPYFPFLLDIKSLTLLVYVQFSSDSIPFSHTLSLILDISCHFLFFISNFYPAKFVFHLHRPWLWIFPAIFS